MLQSKLQRLQLKSKLRTNPSHALLQRLHDRSTSDDTHDRLMVQPQANGLPQRIGLRFCQNTCDMPMCKRTCTSIHLSTRVL